jgi:hypothetical protein
MSFSLKHTSNAPERQRNGLAAADAKRHDPALDAVALHRMEETRDQHPMAYEPMRKGQRHGVTSSASQSCTEPDICHLAASTLAIDLKRHIPDRVAISTTPIPHRITLLVDMHQLMPGSDAVSASILDSLPLHPP